jgi:hypothetical protein
MSSTRLQKSFLNQQKSTLCSNKMAMTDYSNYDRLLEQAKAAGLEAAKTWIPKHCYALREEDKNLSKEDIRDRVAYTDGNLEHNFRISAVTVAVPRKVKGEEDEFEVDVSKLPE